MTNRKHLWNWSHDKLIAAGFELTREKNGRKWYEKTSGPVFEESTGKWWVHQEIVDTAPQGEGGYGQLSYAAGDDEAKARWDERNQQDWERLTAA